MPTDENEPMIKLDPGGKAPILSYNVPEPTSYTGRNLIELDFPESYFKKTVVKRPENRIPLKNLDQAAVKSAVQTGMKTGFFDPKVFPTARMSNNTVQLLEKSPKLTEVDPDDVAARMQAGMRLNVYTTLFGTLSYNFIPEPKAPRPRLLLVETYRLSTFHGCYGAGRSIKTFSLLPGEKTKISVKSYMRREQDAKSASSVLDSFTQESADDFERSVQSEQSNTEKYSENFEYHAEAEASCSWGFGSAKVSGGVKGGSNSAREEFAKNVSNATAKHASKASAKRDVQVNTSFEVKEQSGEETSIERDIQNINLSRTLNFVFRQMNQEFITMLHLVDARIAFFNGYSESRREVPLPELDSLLADVIVPEKIAEVRQKVVEQLTTIIDYEDKQHTFVTEEPLKDASGATIPGSGYLRTLKNTTHLYYDPASGTQILVPGVIVAAKKLTMRTDGIIVDAFLGEGEALDGYARKLQELEVARRDAEVALGKAKAETSKLINEAVEDNDPAKAAVLDKVLHASEPQPAAFKVVVANNGGGGA